MDNNSITDNLHHDVYPAIDPKTTLKGSCTGKTVLITGAGRGIGKITGVAFALAGASTIVITSRSPAELADARAEILAAAPGADVVTHTADVADEDSVRALFDMLAARNIALDVLINNAGYTDYPSPAGAGSPTAWWRAFEVNVKGTYLPTHFALQQLRAGIPLTIICTSSAGALQTMPGFSAYGPSKCAVNRFVDFLHAEYADKGVRAFVIHPGVIATKLALDVTPAEWLHVIDETPEMPAGFCVWLASQKAADHFRGKYLSAGWDVDAIVAGAEAKSPDEKERWLKLKLVV